MPNIIVETNLHSGPPAFIVQAIADISVKTGVFPIRWILCPSMFDRIVMDVFDMCSVVVFITDLMLPEATLPNSLLFLLGSGLGWCLLVTILASLGEQSLDQAPAGGEIAVTIRQSPDAVQMVGQQDKGVDSERIEFHDAPKDIPEQVDILNVVETLSFPECIHREEIGATLDVSPTILHSSFWSIRVVAFLGV